MNRRSFLYILAKLHAKIIKSKQDTFAYYNVACACRLLIVSANVHITYICYLKNLSYIHIFGYSFIVYSSKYHHMKRCHFLNIFAKLQSKIQENRQNAEFGIKREIEGNMDEKTLPFYLTTRRLSCY